MKMLFTKSTLIALLCGAVMACGVRARTAETSSVTPLQLTSFDIIDEEVTNTIAEQLSHKCERLFPQNATEKKECHMAAKALAGELDFNFIRRSDGQSAFVFMHRRLKKLLSEKTTIDFLAALQTAAEDALYVGKSFNLWSLALQHSNGNPEIATEKLAVLIQDGAETAAQVKYLLIAQHPQALNLAQTVQVLEQALAEKKATAYPEHIALSRTALYHYYVPRFLSQQLRKNGIRKTMAARLPFLFNSVYELHQIQKVQNPNLILNHRTVQAPRDSSQAVKKLVEKWNSYDALYSDLLDHLSAPLEPFESAGQANNIADLYLGYAGACAGSSLEAQCGTFAPVETFASALSTDPLTFFKKLPESLN
jgi:hypothetical protein